MRLTHKPPPVKSIVAGMRRRYKTVLYRGAQYATDRASREAHQAVKARMKVARLGRLTGAVGHTSSMKKGQTPRSPYGVIYAKGGDESRAGQALYAYTTGVTIRTRDKEWLAFATPHVPRTVGRRRLTPELYKKAGLSSSIGKLEFKPINRDLAYLVVRKVTLHPRTHRAKAAGPRAPRTRIAAKEIVAFVLIRVTRRARRFDKDNIMRIYSGKVPDYIGEFMDHELAKAA